MAKKETKPKSSDKKGKGKGVKFDEILHDDDKRDMICLSIGGEGVWFPRGQVKVNKSSSTVEMPKWLKEVKLGK